MIILSKMLSENKDGGLTPKQVEYAETIYSSGADLLGLINEILDLSKIESGAMGVEASDVELNEVALDMESLFRQVAKEKGLDLQIQLEDNLPEAIVTDKKRLQQVLKNLISNALKFTDEGYVKLHSRPAGPDERFEKEVLREAEHVIAFSVSDTGRGISPDKQQIIFEAFQQADTGESRSAGGTGLGLSISREIARLLGGELDLESTPGEGSTFTFYLPDKYVPTKLARKEGGDGQVPLDTPSPVEIPTLGRRKKFARDFEGDGDSREAEIDEPRTDTPEQDVQHEAPQARTSAPAEARRTEPPNPETAKSSERGGNGAYAEMALDLQSLENRVQKIRVADDRNDIGPDDHVLLVVEDDPHFAGVVADIAHEKNFKIISATHAEEALALAKRYMPSAITLDIKLPGTHGLVLLDQLKNDPETRHIPVTILSVVDQLPRRQRKGALSQLTKPASREQVDATIEQMQAFADRRIKNLLMVEDDEDESMSISKLLSGDDVQITSVNSAEEALKQLEENSFDCAVIDLGLPGMGGFDLLEKIRAELGLDGMPIVVHTAMDLSDAEMERLQKLADAVVVKDVRSLDRLLHETSIFLHRPEERLSEDARRRLVETDQAEASLQGKKVLIVDDDIRNIFAITSLLERHGMDIEYAESGKEGIDKLTLKEEDFDAVLMDIMMPGMDGYETTRSIRKMKRFKDLPIIAVTAKAMKGDREKCIDAGASDYITKPVNVEQLISILRLWIAS